MRRRILGPAYAAWTALLRPLGPKDAGSALVVLRRELQQMHEAGPQEIGLVEVKGFFPVQRPYRRQALQGPKRQTKNIWPKMGCPMACSEAPCNVW